MSLEKSPICQFGWPAPDFDLKGIDDRRYSLSDVRGARGTLIMFICNHCPYVRAIARPLAEDVRQLQEIGIGVVGIMSNDTQISPGDSFDKMKGFAADHGFTFPYVIDETQDVARAYDAVCTPDFFGFDADLGLQYRGRFDESGASPAKPGAAHDLLDAMTAVAATGNGPSQQIPSMGCSIKWR